VQTRERSSTTRGVWTNTAWQRAEYLLVAIFISFTIAGFDATPSAAAERASANGTFGKQIVDAQGAVWTFDGTRVLRDGVWTLGGQGQEYLYNNGAVYVINELGAWRWRGDRWTLQSFSAAIERGLVTASAATIYASARPTSGTSSSTGASNKATVTPTSTSSSTSGAQTTTTNERTTASDAREVTATSSTSDKSSSSNNGSGNGTSSVSTVQSSTRVSTSGTQVTTSTHGATNYSGGLRTAITSGSISGGSNQLEVDSASGFEVGDWVIVEIGKEAGQGRRGTRGVGGTWPAKSYRTEAELLSDKGQPNRLFAWAEDTGYAYWWLDGQWYDLAPNRPNTFYTGQYYLGKAVPRSLQARITAIDGRRLTLDKSAVVSSEGANVYLDTAPILSNIIANSGKLSLPAGNFPTGGVVWIKDKSGFELSGDGKDHTTIYSPKGVPSAMIQAYNAEKTLVRDLTLQGNFRDEGFGLNWTGSTTAGTNQPVTEYDVPQGSGFPRGILFHVGSHDSEVKDVRVIDVSQQAVGVMFADNVWARRVVNIQNDLLRQYVQWQFQWADSTGGGCEDCEVRSTYVISGFEAFKAANVQFIRPKGVNAMFAMNGSGGWIIADADLRFTPNSLHPESDRYQASPWHAVINVNTNIGITPQVALGGTIRNVTIIQSGYLNANNDSLQGIAVNAKNPDIRIEGAAYYAPDYNASTVSNGALGVNSTGPSTTINGALVIGKPQPGRANIFVMNGSGQNCSADVIEGCSRGSYTSPRIAAFLAGDTSDW
jgi:hypothetical protein